jgi:23S rRNA (uracil1939-C5)-methyltransferase
VTPVRILRLAAGGDGVGRLADGRAVFVPRTAPGDLVELSALEARRRFARARVGRLLESGADRVEPRCPHYVADECGGCQLQHLGLEGQREARRGFVGDALRRLAKVNVADPEIVPSAKAYDYRTKLTLTATPGAHRIGLHPYGRPDRVFDLEWCHITRPELMQLWVTVRELRRLLPPGLDRLVLRLDRAGRRHLVLRVTGARPWHDADRLEHELTGRGVDSAIWWQPTGGAPATIFEQVHPEMGDRVRDFALDQLAPVAGRVVWDLYAGIGETTARLASEGAQVESVESDPRAVAEAEARGPVARRHAAKVEDVLAQLSPPDLVVTNPPRTGMDAQVTAAMERVRPQRIVYLSCDPATLARDLTRLPSYRIALLRAFDLFPQTAHVETVAVLDRAS